MSAGKCVGKKEINYQQRCLDSGHSHMAEDIKQT